MGAVDTNLLIRCIVQDDQHQCDAVSRLRRQYLQVGCRLFVPVTVLLELEWVLRSCFGYDKVKIIDAMTSILDAQDLHCDRETAMGDALAVFQLSDADFADCMHARIAAWEEQGPLHTFDRRAAALPGAELLRVRRGGRRLKGGHGGGRQAQVAVFQAARSS